MSSDLILYDGVCGLCNWSVRFIIRHDSKQEFLFAPLQGETAKRYAAGVPDDGTFRSLILIRLFRTDAATVHLKSEAILLILDSLGGVWWVLSWFRVLPKGILDWIYDLIARNRYRWFGKYDACPVPPPVIRSRFLG